MNEQKNRKCQQKGCKNMIDFSKSYMFCSGCVDKALAEQARQRARPSGVVKVVN